MRCRQIRTRHSFMSCASEPPNVTPAAAIANAVYAATGARITALPLKPERVKAALKG
jgi:CO/xanthine dehydrogenase Mo-binding subunit